MICGSQVRPPSWVLSTAVLLKSPGAPRWVAPSATSPSSREAKLTETGAPIVPIASSACQRRPPSVVWYRRPALLSAHSRSGEVAVTERSFRCDSGVATLRQIRPPSLETTVPLGPEATIPEPAALAPDNRSVATRGPRPWRTGTRPPTDREGVPAVGAAPDAARADEQQRPRGGGHQPGVRRVRRGERAPARPTVARPPQRARGVERVAGGVRGERDALDAGAGGDPQLRPVRAAVGGGGDRARATGQVGAAARPAGGE